VLFLSLKARKWKVSLSTSACSTDRTSKPWQLLQHTSKSLTEVAVASGFISFPHFYRRFRELFAIAPRQFRARCDGWAGRQEVAVH